MRLRTSYAAFESAAEPPLWLAGRLDLPVGETSARKSLAAVLICHGSDGVDGRGAFHATRLNEAGLATLEIDMWAARGTVRGAAARPASPLLTLPDAFGALAFLAAQPEIDPGRVGVMGFSWGGAVSLLAARARPGAGLAFAAHAALYPVCWAYQRIAAMALENLTPAPILILTGVEDAYDRAGAGPALAEKLIAAGHSRVRAVEYARAGHGFDRDLPPQTITDPFAHEGAGGEVVMAFEPDAARAAREEVVGFFLDAL
ncbi:MAG TPA: dienelactone hydrolase family protein [Caulobacteraceae bacterium]|nr:dienelactone hydrolase family protein [Caulobacteraceae bacterium]